MNHAAETTTVTDPLLTETETRPDILAMPILVSVNAPVTETAAIACPTAAAGTIPWKTATSETLTAPVVNTATDVAQMTALALDTQKCLVTANTGQSRSLKRPRKSIARTIALKMAS